MAAEHPTVEVDDLARRLGLGAEPLHEARIIAVGHEADVLAVWLGRDLQPHLRSDPPHLVLRQIAEREAQEIQLLARRPVEKIALVAARVGALVKLDAAIVHAPPHIMPSRQAIRADLAREGDESTNFTPWLQLAHGTGVRPWAYSSTKRSITPSRKRLS